MKVARFPIKISNRRTTLVLGAFESFHCGHMALIDKARESKQPITLMMIENPNDLPNKKTTEYCAFETRLVQAANLSIDQAVVITFSEAIKNKDGEKFLEELIDVSNASAIVVGKDFAMGHNRQLTSERIKSLFANTIIVEPVKFNNTKLSTTTLKELVETGDVDVIKKLSPFSYTITTNVKADKTFAIDTTMPHKGVYAAWTVVDDVKYWSLIKIGFEKNEIVIPDLDIVNSGFDARIEMRKMVRIIIRRDQDEIKEEDRDAVITYLSEKSLG